MDVRPANGINGSNGRYLLESVTAADLASAALGLPPAAADVRHADRIRRTGVAAVREGLDPKCLDQVGWGLVFAADAPARDVEAIKEALAPLIERRREQAGRTTGSYFQVYEGERGLRAGESKAEFFGRHGVGLAGADPRQMPYYLLLIGGPREIGFRAQYQLDVQRAVGRLAFERIEDYATYAANVVAAEDAPPAPGPILFFGPRNPDDGATALSASQLLQPLADWALEKGWETESVVGEGATKSRLAEILTTRAPRILFTASHGMGFGLDDPRLRRHQGALLCQDWPGPNGHSGAIPESYYFSADDVPAASSMKGMIACHFACFSLGTPEVDEFAILGGGGWLAPEPFVAALPQRLLATPDGPLAVIGHVERAWGYSFYESESGRQLAAFEDMLLRLMQGHPVGSALEPINSRYAELATMLSEELDERRFGKRSSDALLAALWTANNDARNYALLGDPAVRLGAAAGGS
ncbi:MAG TPA: hypothetical protein VF718_03315 [Allosphingosinicella sp.]